MLGYTARRLSTRITPADISDPQEVIARPKNFDPGTSHPITPGFEALVFKASRGIEDIYELTTSAKMAAAFPRSSRSPLCAMRKAAFIGYLLIGTDNTARKQVEAEQKLLDQRLRDQQFYTRSLIEIEYRRLDDHGSARIITDVNQQMEALTGLHARRTDRGPI